MASAFKWRLTENLFSYLTDVSGNTPQINSGYTTDIESVISKIVSTEYSSEQVYAAKFNEMKQLILSNPSTSGVTLLNYSYYYDMNENSCGLLNGGVGDKGERGLRGEKGEKGDNGKDGRGISNVDFQDIYSNGVKKGTKVTFEFTEGSSKSFDVMDGKDGASQQVDYNHILSGITNLGLPEQIINNIETDLYPYLQEYFDQIYSGALDDINRVKNALSSLSGSVGGLRFDVNAVSGQTGVLAQYYDIDHRALNTIDSRISAVSGVAYTNMSRIDTINSGVTRVGQEMDVMSGYIRNYVEEVRVLDEKTSSFTRDISDIRQTARAIESTVESISGNVRNLSDMVQTASSVTTSIMRQVGSAITDISVLQDSYSSLTSDIQHVSGQVRNASQIAQTASGIALQARQEVCGVTSGMSELWVAYSGITMKVDSFSGDVVTYSEIDVVATAITANVYDGLKRTGIDIQSGEIILNADRTTVSGNLTLSGSTDGISFNDISGNTKINLSTQYLPNLENFDMAARSEIFDSKTQFVNNTTQTVTININGINLGNFKQSQTIHFDRMILGPHFSSERNDYNTENVDYNIAVIQNSTIIQTRTGRCSISQSWFVFGSFLVDSFEAQAPNDGNVTLNIELIATSAEAKMGNYITEYLIEYQKLDSAQTIMRLNGFATFKDVDHYAWLGPDQSAFKQGRSAFRIKDGRIQRTPLDSEYVSSAGTASSYFMDISTCIPYRLYSDGITYTASTVDDGFIGFWSTQNDDHNAQRTLVLPSSVNYPGKMIWVKNFSGNGNTMVITEDGSADIIAKAANTPVSSVTINKYSAMFLSNVFYWVQFI